MLGKLDGANVNVLDTKNFNWVRDGISNNTKFVELQMNGNEYNDVFANTKRQGNVQIMVRKFQVSLLNFLYIISFFFHFSNCNVAFPLFPLIS